MKINKKFFMFEFMLSAVCMINVTHAINNNKQIPQDINATGIGVSSINNIVSHNEQTIFFDIDDDEEYEVSENSSFGLNVSDGNIVELPQNINFDTLKTELNKLRLKDLNDVFNDGNDLFNSKLPCEIIPGLNREQTINTIIDNILDNICQNAPGLMPSICNTACCLWNEIQNKKMSEDCHPDVLYAILINSLKVFVPYQSNSDEEKSDSEDTEKISNNLLSFIIENNNNIDHTTNT